MKVRDLIYILADADAGAEVLIWADRGQCILPAGRAFDMMMDDTGDAIEPCEVESDSYNIKALMIEA